MGYVLVDKYIDDIASLTPCGVKTENLDKIMVNFGAPKIGGYYTTSYINLKQLCDKVSNNFTINYTDRLRDDWNDYNAILEIKESQLQKHIDAINERIAPKKLFEHQVYGSKWMLARNGCILADEMGLGKTLQVIAQIPPKAPCIIVAPVNAKYVWQDEFKKWVGRNAIVISGRNSFRWPNPGEIIITNYEILPRGLYLPIPSSGLTVNEKQKLRKELRESRQKILSECPEYLVLVADEGHRLKNLKAQRTKRFRYISEEVQKKSGRVIITTGTPQKKDGHDLRSLLTCIGKFDESFGSYTNFKDQMQIDNNGRVGEPKESAKYYLSNVMLRRKKSNVLDLPEIIHDYVKVEVDEKYIDICNDFERKCAEMGVSFEEAFEMARDPQSSLYIHICKVKSALALSKGPAVEDMILDYENAEEPIIVGCTHLDVLNVLAKRKGWAIIKGGIKDTERKRICDEFQAGKLKGLALSTLAASEALTLHRSCAMIVVDRWWGPTENDQLIARIHRPGQTRNVIIKELLIDHPIERHILQLCDIKRRDINKVIEGVSEIQK